MISTGYIPVAKHLQLGSLWTTFGNNGIQGTKVKLGLRSFKTRDDRFRIQTYLSHGFRDKSWNYGFAVNFLVGFKPRWVIGFSKTNDIQQMGGKLMEENELILDQFANAILKRGENHYLTAFHNHKLMTEVAIHKNLRLNLLAYHKSVASAHSGVFPMGYVIDRKIQSKSKDVGVRPPYVLHPPEGSMALVFISVLEDLDFPRLPSNLKWELREFSMVIWGTNNFSSYKTIQ